MTFAKRTVCPPQPAVLVTGASSGIGKDCVRAFVAKGWHVFPVVRRPADVDSLRALCPSAACLTPLLGSVTEEASMEEVVKKLTQCLAQGAAQGGAALRLQAVVASAGMGAFAPLELSSLDLWREVFEVNVFAVASMSRLLLPLLRDAATSPGPAPRIIVVGSAAGRLPGPMQSTYCASKHAVEGLVDCMRMELRPHGVKVVLLQPGLVATALPARVEAATEQQLRLVAPKLRAVYQNQMEEMQAALRTMLTKSIHVEEVVQVVEKAACARSPSPRYAVGPGTKTAMWLRARCSDTAWDRLTRWTGLRMAKMGRQLGQASPGGAAIQAPPPATSSPAAAPAPVTASGLGSA
ncbi:hypothetical protein V8C86DRAFT_2681237 [Haematococcus lacustris]